MQRRGTEYDNPAAGAPRKLFGVLGEVVSAAFKQWEEVVCPLCQVPPKPFAVDCLGFRLCRCPGCGLQFLNPRPTADQLVENVYNETYFAETESASGISDTQQYQFSRQLQTIERLRGRHGILLDVGCGNGAFLRYIMDAGWHAAGTDIQLAAGARDLSCPLWEGQLHEIHTGNERFDAIRLNHVLEHMQNPLLELNRCRELLKERGILFVSVPNIAGISPLIKNLQSRFHLKRRRYRHYGALHHLWFFSPSTLRRLVECAGFRVLHWETPVLRNRAQGSFIERIYWHLFERSHSASILDFYLIRHSK